MATVEDLIKHIDARFDRIDSKLDARVAQLEGKLEAHTGELHERINATKAEIAEVRVDSALTKGKLMGIGIPLAVVSGWLGHFLKAVFDR